MTQQEKQQLEEDSQKFIKSQENNSKVDAFFNNFGQEVDDSSPRAKEEPIIKQGLVASSVNLQQASPFDPINPKKINAFELANIVTGTIVNRVCNVNLGKMIQGFSFSNNEHLTSNKTLEEIVHKIVQAFETLGSTSVKRIEPYKEYKLEGELKRAKNELSIIIELCELKQGLYLLIFSQGKGTLIDYLNLYPNFFNLVQELRISKGK